MKSPSEIQAKIDNVTQLWAVKCEKIKKMCENPTVSSDDLREMHMEVSIHYHVMAILI